MFLLDAFKKLPQSSDSAIIWEKQYYIHTYVWINMGIQYIYTNVFIVYPLSSFL